MAKSPTATKRKTNTKSSKNSSGVQSSNPAQTSQLASEANTMTDENISILEFSEDVSTAEAPDPIPTGDYRGDCIEAEVKTSANTGNRYLQLGFRIARDDLPADFDADTAGVPDEGVLLYWRRSSLEDNANARFRLRSLCESMDVPVSKSLDLNEFVGKEALLTITHSTYEGVKRADIAKISAA